MFTKPKFKFTKFNSIMIIMVLVFSGINGIIIYDSYTNPLQSAINGITVGLDIKAYHSDGKLFADRYMPNDLTLDNFNFIMLAFFTPYVGSAIYASGTRIQSAGTTNSLCIKRCGGGASFNIGSGCNTSPYCGAQLAIGTGSGVSRTDYKLVAEYGTNFAVTSTALSTGTTDSVVLSGSQSITTSTTITEAGLGIAPLATNTQNGVYLLFHDSFTGISVINGDVVTVQYTINLNNAGFNANLATVLAGLLTGQLTTGAYPANTGVSITLTKTGGATNSFYVYCAGSPTGMISTTSSCGSVTNTNDIYIAIGTSSSAFTPTSNQLTAQLATSTVSVQQYISSAGEIYFTSNFVVGSSNSIQEAGLFRILSSNNYLFFGTTFTAQAQTANIPFGMSLEMLD